MKALRLLLAGAILATAGLGNAWADHHGHHGGARVGVYVGAPLVPWYYAPSPYYYYPAPVVIQSVQPVQPPVYVEQGAAPTASPPSSAASNYWYYCATAQAYYPYVKDCPGGWQTVTPQPPPPGTQR